MTSCSTDRTYAAELEAADPLREFRNRFSWPDEPLIYLDGNSLGPLPLATRQRISEVVGQEWGAGLVRSWDRWIELPRRAGAAIGRLIGAAPGQVIVCDSTTVNLYKLWRISQALIRAGVIGDYRTPDRLRLRPADRHALHRRVGRARHGPPHRRRPAQLRGTACRAGQGDLRQ